MLIKIDQTTKALRKKYKTVCSIVFESTYFDTGYKAESYVFVKEKHLETFESDTVNGAVELALEYAESLLRS